MVLLAIAHIENLIHELIEIHLEAVKLPPPPLKGDASESKSVESINCAIKCQDFKLNAQQFHRSTTKMMSVCAQSMRM